MEDGFEPGCVFCRIVAGTAPSSVVHRDDLATAFLDIRPVTSGHLLVVPNRHAAGLAGVAAGTLAHLFELAASLAEGLRRSGLRADGVNLLLADGEAAGQEVEHSHVHVIPRFAGDGFSVDATAWRNEPPSRDMLDEQAARITGALRTTAPAVASVVRGLDHVQVSIPPGGEPAARDFYGGVLGLTEVTKPPGLAARGGVWLVGQGTHLHLGVEGDFQPARKAHVALVVAGLREVREALAAAGVDILEDEAGLGIARIYVADPFGNRLELVDRRDRGFTGRQPRAG